MSSQFDSRFGQELCDMLSTELGLVCSFMAEEGRIVASSNNHLIGQINPVAGRIMQGSIDEYDVSSEEACCSEIMHEGISMGIDLAGERLIVFSISGSLQIVRPMARIIRFCVRSLLCIRQENAALSPQTLAEDSGNVPNGHGKRSTPDNETSHARFPDGPTSHSTRLPKDSNQVAAYLPNPLPQAGEGANESLRVFHVNQTASNLKELLNNASQTIEHSLTRLRDAVENINQGITLFDTKLRLVVWNRRFLELINIPQQSIVFGLSLESIIRCYARQAGYDETAIEAIVAERMAVVNLRLVNHSEHKLPSGIILELVDRPLPNGGLVTTYTDVTRRRHNEAALRSTFENAERLVEIRTRDLRDFAELSSDWFWAQDADFRFIEFSGHATDKLRRPQTDYFGKRRWEMPISGVSSQKMAEHIAICERHEAFRNFEYEIPGADGTLQFFSISGTPIFDELGNFEGYRGVGKNITELRCAELATRESEQRLSQIIDGTSIPLFVIDAEHRVTHWNQACAKLTGFTPRQMIGSKEVWRAFYPQARPTLANLIVQSVSEAQIKSYYQKVARSTLISNAFESEVYLPEADGADRWLYFAAAPLRDSSGKLTGAIESLQNITERRRDQQLLEARTEALLKSYTLVEERINERTAELSQQLHFQQQLIEAIPGPVYYKDTEARYLGCNSAFEAFIGQSAKDLIGKQPSSPENHDLASDLELLSRPGSQIYEAQSRYANGELRDVMFHKASFTRPDGSVGGLVGLMLDISERKRMESNLRQAATVFESAAEGVIITKPDGTIIAVNHAFSEITGYSEQEALGQNPRMLQSNRHDPHFYRQMWDSIAQNGRWQGEVWNRRKNGDAYPEWLSITSVCDNQGNIANYVATFSDIGQQKLNEARIELLAFSDPLTQLPNRRLLLDRLQHSLVTSLRNNRHGALFFIDLDDFKDLNDTLGHDIGDMLLQQVAQRLLSCVRESDTVARFGGDEFVVMLDDLSENLLEACNHAEQIGEKILASLNQTYLLQSYSYHGTPSIGITLFGGQDACVDDLLKQADLAMYQAKGAGRNALRFFDPKMQTAVSARVVLETQLRLGIQENQFILYYQPQMDHRGRVTGAEALVRWQHPTRGLVFPAEFIPLAEQTELIIPLGSWILTTACQQLAAWTKNQETSHLTLAVNVSARQFSHADFVERVCATLERHRIGSGQLKLEITESILLDDIEGIIEKMVLLKSKGVGFALDDFGTGYSSLSYLKRLPLDQLKIDQSFVRDVLCDPGNATIARAIVALAHNLGLGVIAEGVETEEQLLFLASNGCHVYQGYLFSRPLPLEGFEQFLRRVPAMS